MYIAFIYIYLWPNNIYCKYKIIKLYTTHKLNSTQHDFNLQSSDCVSLSVSLLYVLEQVGDANSVVRGACNAGAEAPPPL